VPDVPEEQPATVLSTRAISRTAVSRSDALEMSCSASFVTITSKVTSVVELLADDSAPFIAEGPEGESYNYGQEGFPSPGPNETTAAWFGQAILRPDL
jgi:hypothetical protein